MPEEGLTCYNKGCGKKFNNEENCEDSCNFHPGVPVFHDAYKGWSCCKKKCTDFTEFLNIKGCATSYHSNVKPPEPEKPAVDKEKASEVIEVRPPIEAAPARLPRPPFESPMATLKPTIASNLVAQIDQLALKPPAINEGAAEIALGTNCKHKGCKAVYSGLDDTCCQYHPGVPVFHEGLKFWSCCTKRTTEFSAFLEQVGCTKGNHKWIEEEGDVIKPTCRHDWHQTGSEVIISIYAKKYSPLQSSVQLNPIRAKIDLIFVDGSPRFEMDLELRGVIDVNRSQVNMLGTKVEIKLRKAELGSWSQLDFPRGTTPSKPSEEVVDSSDAEEYENAVDISDI